MYRRHIAAAATAGLILATGWATPVAAHNRAHIVLPSGVCMVVGSVKSVSPGPGKEAFLDLDPSTPADEIGTSFAASAGKSALQKGACP